MTNFTTAVAASADDVTETAAGVMHSLSNNSLIASFNNYHIAMRFQNVTIPPGSTVTAAVLHVFAESSSYDDPNGTFYGEAADNPGAFSTTSSDISNRTKTTASVGWATTAIGTGDSASPDLSAIIQEIIDRGGWSSGNALVVMFKASTSSPNLRIRSYDYGSNIPYISIDYTAPETNVDESISLSVAQGIAPAGSAAAGGSVGLATTRTADGPVGLGEAAGSLSAPRSLSIDLSGSAGVFDSLSTSHLLTLGIAGLGAAADNLSTQRLLSLSLSGLGTAADSIDLDRTVAVVALGQSAYLAAVNIARNLNIGALSVLDTNGLISLATVVEVEMSAAGPVYDSVTLGRSASLGVSDTAAQVFDDAIALAATAGIDASALANAFHLLALQRGSSLVVSGSSAMFVTADFDRLQSLDLSGSAVVAGALDLDRDADIDALGTADAADAFALSRAVTVAVVALIDANGAISLNRYQVVAVADGTEIHVIRRTVFIVKAESRGFTVDAESRAFTVDRESRQFIVRHDA